MNIKTLIAAVVVAFLTTACGGGSSGGGSTSGGGGGGNTGGSGGSGGNTAALSLNTIGDQTTAANNNVNFILSSSNPNGGTLSYSVSVVTGSADPFNVASGNDATFNMSGNGTFNWTPSDTEIGSYQLQFTVQNTNGESDSETIMIVVEAAPGQFEVGENNYNDRCQRCHGPGGNAGSAVPIQCIDSLTYYSRINGGNMSGYASGWSDSDRDAVFFYLNNVDPGNC